jgi:hypothetical protein
MLVICDDANPSAQPYSLGDFLQVDLPVFGAGIVHHHNGATYRDAEQWLTDRQLKRYIGLPVVMDDLTNYVGTIFGAYREEDTVRALVRVYSRDFIELIDTEPQPELAAELVYAPGDDGDVVIEDECILFIEPLPKLLNYVKLTIMKG